MLTLMHLREKIKCNLVHYSMKKLLVLKQTNWLGNTQYLWLAHENNTKKALYNKKCNKKTKV